MIKRTIQLKNQQKLELELTEEFLSRVVNHFSLQSNDDIDDDHLIAYIHSAVKNGVDKAEKQLHNKS